MTDTPIVSNSPNAPQNAPKPRARRFIWIRVIGSLVLLAIVLWYVGKELRADFHEIKWSEVHFEPVTMLLAMCAFVLVRVLNGINIKLLLAAMGISAPARKVLPIVWVASIGRYIPGKIAVVGGSLLMLVGIGVPLSLAMASLFMATALTMLTGLIASVPLLFTDVMRQLWPSGPTVALVSLTIGCICLYPPIFLRLCNLITHLLKRPPLPARVKWIPFSSAIGLTLVRVGLLGVCLWLSARILQPLPLSQLPYCVGVAGLATTIGFLAVFAPAGLGVHEKIYLKTMEPLLGPQVAIVVVLVRLFNLLGDVTMAGAGMLLRQTDRLLPADKVPTQLVNAK